MTLIEMKTLNNLAITVSVCAVKVLCRNRATTVAQAHGAYLAWSSVITRYFLKIIGFMGDNQPDN